MDRLRQIINAVWAIERKDFLNLISIVHPAIKAGNWGELEKSLFKERTNVKALNLGLEFNEWELDDENLPANSIAVISLSGTLYSWETERASMSLERALSNGKISGVILKINGVGGMIDGLSELNNLLATAGKPTAAVITGSCMSAHYWIASAAGRRFLVDKTCQVGSIGVLGTYYNATESMRKEGIDFREIYPDSADLKNREYRDIAEKDDEKAYKDQLSKIHALFCDSVSEGLGIPYDKENPLFRGATFMGDEAIRAGLADAYGNVADAARWILAKDTLRRVNDNNNY